MDNLNLIINGQEQTISGVQTVRDLVVQQGLGKAAVAVELNQKLVPRKQHETQTLCPGDQLELVTLVGGG